MKAIEDLTCEHCLHNTPSGNGWCTLHSMNTFKLALMSCHRCHADKLEFKDACADYKTQSAAPSFVAPTEFGRITKNNEMGKEALISSIISLEWKMFHDVQNIGGPASCQNDAKTFKIMRHSQAMSWSEITLESYLDDLKNAESNGRNMMTEKYARMMASTSPDEYSKIKDRLPPVDPCIADIIEAVIEQVLDWEEALIEQYPHVFRRGRPLYSREDNINVTSLETYLRGELSTFSLKTIKFYHQDIETYAAKNKNMSEIILEETMKKYGFDSLAAANDRLKRDLL